MRGGMRWKGGILRRCNEMRLLQQMIKVKEEYTARFSAQNFTREPLIFGTILRNPPKEGWFPSEAGLRMAFRHSRIEVDCGMERE